MNPRGTALRLVSGSRSLARPTVRLRLAAIYTGVFLVVGIALIAITYGLLSQQLNALPPWIPPRANTGQTPFVFSPAQGSELNAVIAHQRTVTLHQLIVQAAIALALTTALAAAAGWFASARALRPLRSVTATAHRLSQRNLDERIALRGPRDEIKELADTFDEMLGRLAAAFDAQRRFIANASHELRTPLTRLRALIDVGLADPDADAAGLRTMAERVQAAAEDQERLIDGLLALAQGERGPDRTQPIDLAGLVTFILPATASRHPGPHQPQILTELGPAATAGDRDLLARLVANLIDNALSYNIADGWVRIRTGSQDGQATLQVTNTGPVLPPEVVPMLLEPFRRQLPDRTSTSTRRGSGLGLSIVAAITDAHGGTIDLAAQAGGGLQITVRLPARASAGQQHR
ncbi:MAG TPA: HAMP domain-containing sensor histidine kinase [Streptosporangiaceae bacterium]|nr:HAMP domain-containing sensor histidine kinase [Streptosporangiaceae bacterium]